MSLTQTLDLMLDQLDAAFYTPQNRQVLRQLSRFLPLIERGGFECRLIPAEPVVDFQQCILPAEIPIVQAHFRRQVKDNTTDGLIWDNLFQLLTWAQSNPEIIELWMEYDTASTQHGQARLPLPSVFVGFTQGPAHQENQTFAMLDCLFGRATWQCWKPTLERCFAACQGEVFISHVGAMLSREAIGCRVNVKRLTPESVLAYLNAICWQGDSLPDILLQRLSQCDRFTLTLDVNQQIFPTVGFECMMADQQDWPDFWVALRHCGWMTDVQATDVQAWTGVTTPADYWQTYPEHHLLASLWRPVTEFSRFVRWISHMKFVYHPLHPIQSKIYLWFHHEWENLKNG